MNEFLTTPLDFCAGEGSETAPYTAADGTAGITSALSRLAERGGTLRLPCARYELTKTVPLTLCSSAIVGDVWACNTDPNGVFETAYGTKLRLRGSGFPALRVGIDGLVSGSVIRELGVQGDIVGMDTRDRFDINAPTANAGLVLDAVRTDQCAFERLSFCGLGAAIAVAGNAEVDACNFERCNADGSGVGVYFSPRASFYARFNRNLLADTPYYGVLVDGRGKCIHNLELTECFFVRNGGCFVGEEMPHPAAVTLLNVSRSAVERNNFDDPGLFWYYPPTATENSERQPQKQPMPALYLSGKLNRIRDNVFQHTRGVAVIIEGDGNVLMNNITDGDVMITGKGNTVCGLAFQSAEAKLILRGADDTVVSGVPEDRILRIAP
ncbi:MAG: hypothetical protein E7585_04605 [Ruminococcaceae bacterium]|nr:hypothetical protein [Oscillospiraceae bacterium]